jgi:Tol biopolymer transport system component
MDVSHDGQRLLILAGEGEEHERTPWILNTDGKELRRVGNFLCHAAAWSPDTRRIAYALGGTLYVISTDSTGTANMVHAFAGIPRLVRWSLDGKRIFVVIRDSSWNATIWQIVLNGDDGSSIASLAPASLESRDYNGLAVLDSNDDAFVGMGDTISILRRKRWPWQSGFLLGQLSSRLRGNSALATDSESNRLFVTRDAPANNELDRFDRTSHEFRPFLPGISARDVDFSRDGRHIVYVREPENTLWVSQVDGTAARQVLTPGAMSIELPRWSPDGQRIAFMGKGADAPYRIFITSAIEGPLTEASHGTDNQGAPTWSPDGQRLVYGRVQCQEETTCRLQRIDLKTGEQTMIPGSEGLSTARWSPDGHFIAALRADRHEVWLRDLGTATWRKLADGANGNDLAWSPDSRTVYASRPNGDRPEVIRISVHTGKVEHAVDLSDFSKLPGRIDTWFAVTPDDSILFLHIVSGHEIFGYHYNEQ